MKLYIPCMHEKIDDNPGKIEDAENDSNMLFPKSKNAGVALQVIIEASNGRVGLKSQVPIWHS